MRDRCAAMLVRTILAAGNLVVRTLSTLLFARSSSAQSPRSILVFRTSLLGDFICAIPALVLLRQRYPTARIGLLTIPSTNRTVRRNRGISPGGVPEWLSFVAPSLVDSAFAPTDSEALPAIAIPGLRRFISELNPDVSFILPFSGDGLLSKFKKLIFLRLAGVTKNVYGWKIHATAGLFRGTQFRLGLFDHQVIAPIKALQEYIPQLVIQGDEIKFALAIPEEAETFANQIWRERSWWAKTVVAICPGGAFDHKRWPAENFVALGEKIKEDRTANFIILGNEADCQAGAQLSSVLGNRAVDLTGRTSILQTAAILKKCTLFVGNDSGPAHLASAVGCPTVTVMYSVVFPGIWEPWNGMKSAIRHSVPCEHCFSYLGCPTGTQECIRGITVETVLEQCKRLLTRESQALRLAPSLRHPRAMSPGSLHN